MQTHRGTPTARPYDEAYDEAYDADGAVRPPYRELVARLEDADLAHLTREVHRHLARHGVEFGGDDPHPFEVDALPRILTAEEWDTLALGLRQRVRALDAFVADVYGEQRALAEGIVPERAVTGSPYFEKDLLGVDLPAPWIGIAGLDVVRGSDGRFFVLEDNARTPSGIAYAMAASDAVWDALQMHSPRADLRVELSRSLRGVLEASAPEVDGELVLLTDGRSNSSYYEHRRLAELAGIELAEPGDVRRRGDRLELADGRPVRAVYRRTDDDHLRQESGDLTPTAELVLEPLLAGNLGMVNRFGTGVADDKFVYSYVDDLVRFYLGEEPAVGSVPTYDLDDPDICADVLDRLGELVVKPRDGQGGTGVVVGPTASEDELAEARDEIRADPGGWIAQDVVTLSTAPTVIDGTVVPRHVDLRPFVLYDGREAVVPLGGLTRVALREGSMVVNSSRQGGGKATWVLG